MSDDTAQRVQSFFETFAAKNAAGDVDGLLKLFAPIVMIAGPNGTNVLPSNAMAAAIRSRKQRLDSFGVPSGTMAGCAPTSLNDRYTLARTEWRFDLSPLHTDPVTLSSTFLLEHVGAETRIVVYMNDGDIMAVLRERGFVNE